MDAIVVKNRAVLRAEKRFVLVAMGISKTGKKEVLSFKQAESEAGRGYWTTRRDVG